MTPTNPHVPAGGGAAWDAGLGRRASAPPGSRDEARLRAQVARQARAIRARSIRSRVIGGALALFGATWLLITLMLVTGHDPALAAHKTSTSPAVSSASPTTTSSSQGAAASSGSSSSGTGSGSSSSGGTSSVTTRAS